MPTRNREKELLSSIWQDMRGEKLGSSNWVLLKAVFAMRCCAAQSTWTRRCSRTRLRAPLRDLATHGRTRDYHSAIFCFRALFKTIDVRGWCRSFEFDVGINLGLSVKIRYGDPNWNVYQRLRVCWLFKMICQALEANKKSELIWKASLMVDRRSPKLQVFFWWKFPDIDGANVLFDRSEILEQMRSMLERCTWPQVSRSLCFERWS